MTARERFKRQMHFQPFDRTFHWEFDYPLGVYCGSMIGKIRDMLTFEGLAYACADYPNNPDDYLYDLDLKQRMFGLDRICM
jgi:hypothetical protein